MTDVPSQGWYPDPAGEHQQRWWNGSTWTEHVHDGAPGQPLAAGAARVQRSEGAIGKEYGWVVLCGAGALAIGSLLPWATVTAPFVGTINKNGTEGDGVITLVLALVIVLLGFPLVQQKFEKGRVIATLVIAVLAGAVCAFDIIDVNRIAGDLEDEGVATAEVGFGLYIAGLGALAAAGASGLALRAQQSARPDIQGPPTQASGEGAT